MHFWPVWVNRVRREVLFGSRLMVSRNTIQSYTKQLNEAYTFLLDRVQRGAEEDEEDW